MSLRKRWDAFVDKHFWVIMGAMIPFAICMFALSIWLHVIFIRWACHV